MSMRRVVIVGCGNAALCAGIAALEQGAIVVILEKAELSEMGGNSRYTAGAMRFAYHSKEDLEPFLEKTSDHRLRKTDFGSYSTKQFERDMLSFNGEFPLNALQQLLIDRSYDTVKWMNHHNVSFEPIYSRQSYQKDDRWVFWGGLTLAATGEGSGLITSLVKEYTRLRGEIIYGACAQQLIYHKDRIQGIQYRKGQDEENILCDAVVLACGGFEANADLRVSYMGEEWRSAKVRGTPHNTGIGLKMALEIGAQFHGLPDGCHATPMDSLMPDNGNMDIPHIDRKLYRKICYFLGVMINSDGKRFVDEGENFRNYTYAQFGRAILRQPGNVAWQIFDSKVFDFLYSEYTFWDAHYVEADSLELLIEKMGGVSSESALNTLYRFNASVQDHHAFDPTILDGRATQGLSPNKSNWANTLDTPPFRAYPVTCGITFTYAGLKINENAMVLDQNDEVIQGLYACGEIVGGIFFHGYPGGSGLTSGAVFGKIAGTHAVTFN